MSREYIISVPDDAGFVEYSYIRGGRKYESHYAYRSMGRLVRCGECAKRKENKFCLEHMRYEKNDNGFCSYGEREGE